MPLLTVVAVLLAAGCSAPGGGPAPADECGAAPAGFASRAASVAGTSVHYVIGGSGPPVLLLHGFPETWYTWRAVLPRLASAHTVIAPDLPGVGCSGMAARYDADAMADALHAAVRSAGLAAVAVVGHDTGGWVAYAYARRFRSDVTALVLSGAAIPGFGLEDLLDFRDPRSGLPHLVLFARQPALAEQLIAGREADYFGDFITSDAMHRSGVVDVYARSYARPNRLRAALGQYEAIYRDADDNRRGAAPPLDVPTLALSGPDEIALSATGLRRVARQVAEAPIPGGGHYAQEQDPSAYADALLGFLTPSR